MGCESCAYYIYDEDYDEYYCSADGDEDEWAHFVQGHYKSCPFWRNGDEYAVVRHQM